MAIERLYFACGGVGCRFSFSEYRDFEAELRTVRRCPVCRSPLSVARDPEVVLGRSGLRWPSLPPREGLEGARAPADEGGLESSGPWWMNPWVTIAVVVVLLAVSIALALSTR